MNYFVNSRRQRGLCPCCSAPWTTLYRRVGTILTVSSWTIHLRYLPLCTMRDWPRNCGRSARDSRDSPMSWENWMHDWQSGGVWNNTNTITWTCFDLPFSIQYQFCLWNNYIYFFLFSFLLKLYDITNVIIILFY